MNAALEISIASTLAYMAGDVVRRYIDSKRTRVCANCFLNLAMNQFGRPLHEVFRYPVGKPGIKVFVGINWSILLPEVIRYGWQRTKEKIVPKSRMRKRV